MKIFFTFFIILIISSCVSVEKYNAHIDKAISVDDLRKDVDATKKQLLTKHVNIDMYHSKKIITNRLDSFSNSLQNPMKPNDFQRELSKVVSSFGHGHTVVFALSKRPTKEEKKKYKNSKGLLNLIELKSFDNHLYLNRNYSKDTTLIVNTEVLAINGVSFNDFYKEYQDYRKGDGYISTGDKYMYAGGYLRFLNNQIGLVDSVDITFTKNNAVFTQTMKREFSKKKEKKSIKSVKNDSIPVKKVEKGAKIKLSKEDKKRKKELEKHKSDVKKYFVYNKSKNDYQRELIFPNEEDSTTVILNIKSFSISHGKEAYPFVFDSIQKLNVKNLILDIRNNGGGYAKDINYLYSFLTSREGKQTVMADEMKINSRFSLVKNYFNQFGIVGNTITLPYSLYTYTKTLLKTHKAEDGYFYRSTNKKDYIEQPNKYKGNLYVLTNGSSYSATSVISSALQNEGKAIFVGEETGGDYNGTVAGSMKIYELKKSKLKLLYGLIDFKPNTSRELIGRGVMPNIPISMTFDDVLNKKDPQLDWILNDIKSKK